MKIWSFLGTFAFLSLVQFPAFALSQTVLITPERADFGHIRFSVEGERTTDGAKFVATIALPRGMRGVYAASLSRVRLTDQEWNIQGLQGIELRETEQGFTAEFNLPERLLGEGGISFVVSELHESMPSGTFYILNLKDFPPHRQTKLEEGNVENGVEAKSDQIIDVVILGNVMEPGPASIASNSPSAFDAWGISGGGTRLFGRRISVSRVSIDGAMEKKIFTIESRSRGKDFEEELKKILLQDSDVIQFHGLCEYF